MRCFNFIAICLLVAPAMPACADVNVNMGFSIGVNVPEYPQLVPVPGYPVYFDPDLDSNYFFYDGRYWVYVDDNWYSSDWYNGPWQLIGPEYVPLFILRVPVRYYRHPPIYFHDWHPDGAPHWGERWGHEWVRNHRDWNRWDRRSAPRPAPLPLYQREYSGDRYPHRIEEQRSIRDEYQHKRQASPVQQRRSDDLIETPRSRTAPPMQRQQQSTSIPRPVAPPKPVLRPLQPEPARPAQAPSPPARENQPIQPPRAEPVHPPQSPSPQRPTSPHDRGNDRKPHRDHEDRG